MTTARMLLGLGLLLWACNAYAESMYQINPRIAPRTRESGPILSPLLSHPAPMSPQKAAIQPKKPEVQTTKRIELKPTAEIPVSNTAAPVSKPGMPDARIQPATLEAPAAPPSMEIKPSMNHPVVQPPEGSGSQSAVPVLNKLLLAQAKATEEFQDTAMDNRAVADGGNQQVGYTSQTKPVVDFPEALSQPSPMSPAVDTGNRETDKRIYPVGYKPYTPPVNAEQGRLLETAVAHYNRAGYYLERNRLEDALAEYRQAIAFDRNFADAYVGLSTLSMRKNDWQNVVENANLALDKQRQFLEPANIGQAWFNLSTAYCAADDRRWATKYYEKAKMAGHPAVGPLREFMKQNCTP